MTDYELNSLVASKVMGEPQPDLPHDHFDVLSCVPSSGGNWRCSPSYAEGDVCKWEPKPFCTDIQEAWRVVERMAERGYSMFLEWKGKNRDYAYTAEVTFTYHEKDANVSWTGSSTGHAVGTMPEAICRAALGSLGSWV